MEKERNHLEEKRSSVTWRDSQTFHVIIMSPARDLSSSLKGVSPRRRTKPQTSQPRDKRMFCQILRQLDAGGKRAGPTERRSWAQSGDLERFTSLQGLFVCLSGGSAHCGPLNPHPRTTSLHHSLLQRCRGGGSTPTPLARHSSALSVQLRGGRREEADCSAPETFIETCNRRQREEKDKAVHSK